MSPYIKYLISMELKMLNSLSRFLGEMNFAKATTNHAKPTVGGSIKIEAQAEKRFNQYLLFSDSVFRRGILLVVLQ